MCLNITNSAHMRVYRKSRMLSDTRAEEIENVGNGAASKSNKRQKAAGPLVTQTVIHLGGGQHRRCSQERPKAGTDAAVRLFSQDLMCETEFLPKQLFAELYRKMNPNLTGNSPKQGPIQWTRRYKVRAKINNPIGMSQHWDQLTPMAIRMNIKPVVPGVQPFLSWYTTG
jgi:hypothetical protein